MMVREKNCYYAIALTDFFVFLSCAEMAHLFLPDFSNLTDHSNPIAVLVSLKLTWLVLTIITALSAQLLMIPNVKKDINNAKLRNIFIGHTLMVTALAVAFVATGVMFRTGLPN